MSKIALSPQLKPQICATHHQICLDHFYLLVHMPGIYVTILVNEYSEYQQY